MNVLIVDDQAELRGMIRSALEAAKHVVHEARSAAEGITALSGNSISLVITDLYIPRMDGIDLLQYISRVPNPVPKVIAMIGESYRGRDSAMAAAALLGARSVLCKPFTPADLLRAVSQVEDSEAPPPVMNEG